MAEHTKSANRPAGLSSREKGAELNFRVVLYHVMDLLKLLEAAGLAKIDDVDPNMSRMTPASSCICTISENSQKERR